MNTIRRFLVIFVILMIEACAVMYNPLAEMEELTPTTIMDAPLPVRLQNLSYSQESINKGKYLVELLGCGTCHTDGALVGAPNYQRHMAGSRTGIAYSNPLKQKNPGIVFPANLTPDTETGIGDWSDREIIEMIRSGINNKGGHTLSVMPWPAYAKILEEDIQSIVAYLRSIKPVNHRVPENVSPGQNSTESYVHFGVYRRISNK